MRHPDQSSRLGHPTISTLEWKPGLASNAGLSSTQASRSARSASLSIGMKPPLARGRDPARARRLRQRGVEVDFADGFDRVSRGNLRQVQAPIVGNEALPSRARRPT
jgi:hypothetical protein